MSHNPDMLALFRANAEAVVGADEVKSAGPRGSSTDMGDLAHLMPTIQPYATGCTGTVHGADFLVEDYDAAVANPAAAMALTVVDLLAEGGHAASMLEAFEAPLSKDAYLALQRGFNRRELFDGGA